MGDRGYNKRLRDAQRAYLFIKRGAKCERGGYVDEPQAFDWHHKPGTKGGKSVSDLLGCSLKRIEDEAKKCTLLCPRCHRQAHMEERNASA